MPEDNKHRKVKTIGTATHRTGTLRAAVKPQSRSAEPNVAQIITNHMAAVRPASVPQTFWGTTITKNAAVLRANFRLVTTDEPYLLLDASNGSGKAGMLLSKTGVHFGNGRGSVSSIAWKDLPKQTVEYRQGTLVVGTNGIVAGDGKILVSLLQQIQAAYAK